MDRLRPLWDDAVKAFRTDPSYVIEMARAGNHHSATEASKAEIPEFCDV